MLSKIVLLTVFSLLSGTDLKHSFNFLHDAQGKLQGIVRKKFDAAVSAGNSNAVERFVKLKLN